MQAGVTFEVDLNTAAVDAAVGQRLNRVFQRVMLAVGNSVVAGDPRSGSPGTPVDTGFARTQWRPSKDAPASGPAKGGDGPYPGPSLAPMASARWGETWYLTNSAAYILPLENGHSQQAPRGMVRLSVDAAPLYIADAVAKERLP